MSSNSPHINVQAVIDNDNYIGDGSCSAEGYLEVIKGRLYWASKNDDIGYLEIIESRLYWASKIL
jgi:hypothetical protein